MTNSQSLKRLFPSHGTLPDELRLAAQIHQRTYLIDGRLQVWDGPCKTVLSPVCTTLADGTVQQVPIGSHPEMGEAQSDAALGSMVATKHTEPNKELLNAIVREHHSKFINTGFIL